MKYLPILLLILFTSLCVDLPFDLPAINLPGQNNIGQTDPYLELNVQAIPKETVPGRKLTLVFDMTNNNNYDIRNVYVKAYDRCVFTGGEDYFIPNEGGGSNEGILRPNQTVTWSWEWNTGQTRLEKDCEIKISANYIATYSLSQDIIVMTEDEYLSRQMSGTLYNVPANSQSTKAPFDIELTFPEKQPFLAGTNKYSVYIDYYNRGNGFLTVENSEANIKITHATNTGPLECFGGTSTENLNFINNKAPRVTCYFDAESISQPLSIDSMTIEADYTYLVEKSVLVTVKPDKSMDVGYETNTCNSEVGGNCVSSSICSADHGNCNSNPYECSGTRPCCCVI